MGRKVRDADEARELLSAWSASGEAMTPWCAERGINWYSLSAYNGWLDRERHEEEAGVGHEGGDGFVEVVTTALAVVAPRPSARYRVLLGDRVIEVADDFDDDALRRLIRLVATC